MLKSCSLRDCFISVLLLALSLRPRHPQPSSLRYGTPVFSHLGPLLYDLSPSTRLLLGREPLLSMYLHSTSSLDPPSLPLVVFLVLTRTIVCQTFCASIKDSFIMNWLVCDSPPPLGNHSNKSWWEWAETLNSIQRN